MNGCTGVWSDNRARLIGLLVPCLLLASAGRAFAAPCGSDPGDAAAVAATRALVDGQCNCATASSHSSYIQCAKQVVKAAAAGGLPRSCASSVLKCVRKSTCGKPGAVTCCRTNTSGVTRCRIAKDGDHCRAPRGGSACVGNFTSCCDACNATGCVPLPTSTPVPTKPPATIPPPPSFCQSSTGLPRLGTITFTTTHGSNTCGGTMLSPPPAAPFAGQLTDALDQRLADLGLGCLYTGSLPPAIVPDGSTSILDVVGQSGSRITLAGSAGTGPATCTLGAGPDRHCSNGKPGTDGFGKCEIDADCGISQNKDTCNLDANCYFGPPVPIPASNACAVSTFLTDACGAADLSTNESMLSAVLSSRLYINFDDPLGCPRCVGNTCRGGKNAGKACTGIGSLTTTVECPPLDEKYVGRLTVVIPVLTTGTSTLNGDSSGIFCPEQTSPGAFGISGARKVVETGSPAGGSGNPQAQTLVGTFCLSKAGNVLIDGLGHLPATGALSVPGVLDLTGFVPLPIP